MYGFIFENWILTEIKKNRFNQGIDGGLYFFRDNVGNEVDLVMEKQDTPIAVEIKSGKKMNSSMLSGLRYWLKNNRNGQTLLICGGEKSETLSDNMQVMAWNGISDI